MRASEAVRVVLERHADGRWQLAASDLEALRRQMGRDVLLRYCQCFVQADRLMSLMVYQLMSNEKFGHESVASERNFRTFYFFMMGTLKELSLDLGKLRAA